MSDSKYYWLKLKRDFFKRHDIRIVEGMPNGKEYILFYLKLLCESVDHEGSLRFSDRIPYSEDMLATITSTNVDIVRNAVKVFVELQMMEIMDDGTIFMTEVNDMIGSVADNDNANRQRRYRERQKQLSVTETLQERYASVTNSNESKSIEIDIEKEKEKDIKRKRFTPPTLTDVKQYCEERNNHLDAERFIDFYESKGWMVGKSKMKDWKAAVRTWEKNGTTQKPNITIPMPDYIKDQVEGKAEEPKADFAWLDKYK